MRNISAHPAEHFTGREVIIYFAMNSEKVSESPREEGTAPAHRIETAERVPGNTHYYEKDGLRTYGDGEDHEQEPPVSLVS